MTARPLWIRFLAVLLCGSALLVALVPVLQYARVASSDDEVRLHGTAQHVTLPPGKTWGVYINDANNSGYSESCSAVDANGQKIAMRDPGFTMSSSDTETLDFVFDTGSGDLTITCSVPGEEVAIRPVPNLKVAVLGVLGGAVLGAIGLGLLLNWSFTRSRPEPWAVGGPVYQPIPFPGEQVPWAPAPRKRRSKQQIVGIALGVIVLAVALVLAVTAAWNAAINRIGDDALGGLPGADGEYYEIPGNGDPAVLATGNAFLSTVPAPAGAVSDTYGTTCWVIGAALCITSDTLDNGELLDATTAQLREGGADVKKRWCFIDQCYAYLKYQGAPLMLLVDDPKVISRDRAMVTGFAVGTEDPDAEPPPAAALGSWKSLQASPKSWTAPQCVKRESDGCRQYDGTYAGATTDAKAVADLRRGLTSGGYVIINDTCPESGNVDIFCAIDARRFRTQGSLDGVVLTFRISPGETKGFEVEMTGEPFPA